MNTVVLLAQETHSEEGLPSWAWGVGAFLILVLLLLVTLSFGKGRPHA